MNHNDYPAFVEIWSQAHELYGKSPSDGALNLTFNALKRFDLHQIRQALTAHINDTKHGDFAPKPADIVRHIEGDGDSRALSAWSAVDDAIRRVGPYESVVFDDPITMVVIEDMGGWMGLCEVSDKDLPFKANEFAKRYQGYIGRPPETHPTRLIGLSEARNTGEFSAFAPKPRLIGNPQKCLSVMEQGAEKRRGITVLSDEAAVKLLESRA